MASTVMTSATSHGSIRDLLAARRSRLGGALAHGVGERRLSALVLLPTVIAAALLAVVNLEGWPPPTSAESALAADAWSIVRSGAWPPVDGIAPTWFGLLQLVGYAQGAAAFDRWDLAIMAGRELGAVAVVLAVPLVWLLARRLGLRRGAAALAALLAVGTPLALQLHRTELLDVLAAVWLLLAFVLALNPRRRRLGAAGAALAVTAAVLTSPVVLIALPFLAWVLLRAPGRRVRSAPMIAGAVLLGVAAAFVWGTAALGTLESDVAVLQRVATGDGLGAFADAAGPSAALAGWWALDPVTIALSLVAAVIGLVARALRPIAALVLVSAVCAVHPLAGMPTGSVVAALPFAAVVTVGVADLAVAMLQRRKRRWRALAVATLALTGAAVIAAVPLWSVRYGAAATVDADAPARDARAWLAANLAADTPLAVDDALRIDLVRSGWDPSAVVPITSAGADGWRGTEFLVTADPDAATAAGVASVAFADFDGVEVRRVVPEGVAAARVAEQEAAERRASLGAQLVQNDALVLSDVARGLLRSGRVDERIMIALAAEAADSTVEVASFPAIPGESGDLRRSVAIASLDGQPVVTLREPSEVARRFLDTLRGPWAPSSSISGDSGRRLLVVFPIVTEGAVG